MNETTPLLSSGYPAVNLTNALLPSISSAAARLRDLDVEQICFEDIVNTDTPLQTHPTKVAFALTVLLHLRKAKIIEPLSHDLYERWSTGKANTHDANILDKSLTDLWSLFLTEYRNMRDIETVLWTRFPVERGSFKARGVVDFLADVDSPPSLLTHPIITSHIEHAWNHGVFVNATGTSFITRIDMWSTPRVLHFVDWAFHVLFLVLLTHYLLYPIKQPHPAHERIGNRYGIREVLLVLLPLSFTSRPWSVANISSLLVPLAFFSSLPTVPFPESFTFTLLQFAFVLNSLGLILLQKPSHLFLFKRSYTLPLAALLIQGLSSVLYPAVLFFLPLILLATYLLSLSLADIFLTSAFLLPPPMETRFAFLCFFFTVTVLLLVSIFVLSTTTSRTPWSGYSTASVEHLAQRVFAHTTATYLGCYIFPPPFNLVSFLFITIPQDAARILIDRTLDLAIMERILWRILVGPVAALVALIFWRPQRSVTRIR